MATQTLATADAILKDLYVGPIIEQLNYKTYMLDMIERDGESVDFTGRRAVFPVHSARNLSYTSFPDGGTLPTPGAQGYQDGVVNIRYHGAGMEITDMAIKQATGNEGSFVNLLQADTEKLAQDLKKNINRQVFGSGTGLITTLTSSPAASNTFTVNSTQYLSVGQPIDILNTTTGAVTGGQGLTIQSITRSSNTIVLTSNVTATTATDGVYLAGARLNEMEAGLRNVASTGRTLHGINSATAGNQFWDGQQQNAGSATAGEGLFISLADQIGQVGQGDVDVFLTTRGIRTRLANTYQSTKRFTDAKAVEVHGGYTAIFVNEIPVIADDDVPKTWAFGLRKQAFKWFQVSDPDWLKSEDGTVWQQALGSVLGTKRAAWHAWFVWYAALGCLAPNQNGAIINCTDDAAIT